MSKPHQDRPFHETDEQQFRTDCESVGLDPDELIEAFRHNGGHLSDQTWDDRPED